MVYQLIISITVAAVTALLVFILTNRFNRLSDYRQGLKEIDESFYKPLISQFWNAHHAYAYYFVDLLLEMQEKIIKLLLANKKRVSPWFEREIYKLNQCYSWYCNKTADSVMTEFIDEDKKFVEDTFHVTFTCAEEQY